MFDLDNFDLEFDDDFSSNIFNKGNKNAKENEKTGEVSRESISKCDSNEVEVKNKAKTTNLKENNLKRSFLQDEQPLKKRFSCEGLLARKFPGPAGLLPDKPLREISDLALPAEDNYEQEGDKGDDKEIVYSQNSGSMFLDVNYQRLINDFNLSESQNPLNKYSVEWVKKTALSKGLQGRKIPFLGLVVHSVNQGMLDPVLVLRDPTGEIYGSLHREVWAEMSGKFKAGLALALRQVGVLITGVIRRQIYLNITMNNILSLYSHSENENQVEITTVNKTSQLELLKSFEDWLAQPSKASEEIPHDSPLFTTVNNMNKAREQMRNIKNLTKEKGKNASERKTEEVLANLGIVLSDSDFSEEMNIPQKGPVVRKDGLKSGNGQVLSQAESLIFEEVLSGVNLDEFEM